MCYTNPRTHSTATSGVPQDSVLGPQLFIGLLVINDVSDLFDGTINVELYADDIKIYFEIVNNANVDCLQKGINDLCTWTEKWQLKLSVKCFHLRVGLIKSVPNATYTLYGNYLSLVSKARDLGVLIDAQISFEPHINVIAAKAHMRAGRILRCF